MLSYPKIDPDLFSLNVGSFEIALRWYAVMYIIGYVLGAQIFKRRIKNALFTIKVEDLESFLVHLILGMLIGARIFYVIFYNLSYYLEHPWEIPQIWMGGLSYHGAAVGMIVACAVFAKSRKIPFYMTSDALAYASCLGIFFGRIGNFINGELWGRPTSVPWAMIFPDDPLQLPRHPSQIYQSLGEGLFLFLILMAYQKYRIKQKRLHIGEIGGLYLVLYGLIRFLIEFTRMPDEQVGLLWASLSMGQYLCLAMILSGIGVLMHVYAKMPHYKTKG